jgi:hypothetical protein
MYTMPKGSLTHVCEIFDEFILIWGVHDLIQLDISLEFSPNCWSDFKMLDSQQRRSIIMESDSLGIARLAQDC